MKTSRATATADTLGGGETGGPLRIPGLEEPLSLRLSPELAHLRDKALALHRNPVPGGDPVGYRPFVVELPLSDARAWAAHTEGEDWRIWRARRCAERLRCIPFDLESGECVVGKPLFREPAPAEREQLQEAEQALASMPPFPGGDPGHFHPDYEKLFRLGVQGLLDEVRGRRGQPATSAEQRVFYDACRIVLEGLSVFIGRAAEACEQMAEKEPAEADSWRERGAVCRRVGAAPPATFREAIQLMFLVEIALWFGEDHGLTSPGRMDRTLYPFYRADKEAGRIAPRAAFELIACLFIHMNRILWPGSAIAVMVGGRDGLGRDVTNDLTYLCLAARRATRLVYPTVGLAWHEHTPRELVDFCIDTLGTGIGDPAFFNDDLIAQGLLEHGVSREDSRNYMNSTCVEIKVVGASNMWVTQPYFNCPQALLEVLREVSAGDASEPTSFTVLTRRVQDNLAGKIAAAAERLDHVWRQRAHTGCFPLASCLISDCLARGRDFDRGGARYNWVENSFVGLANLVDSMLTIRELVYRAGELSLAELYGILEGNFQGHEPLRQRIVNTLPKYGNDDDRVDELAVQWADFLIRTTASRQVGPHRYVPGFFCWIQHERLGSSTGATPDGRWAGLPLADGAGAAQGRESRGPTAAVLSTTKWSHRDVLGGLVHNIKFSRSLFRSSGARRAARDVIETYLRRGGFEIQVNVVDKEMLLEAQENPERYGDLCVRVAGYSDYFVHLNRKMQDEVIARTEHEPGG